MKLVSSALSLFLAAPAVYLLRLAAARAKISAPALNPKNVHGRWGGEGFGWFDLSEREAQPRKLGF